MRLEVLKRFWETWGRWYKHATDVSEGESYMYMLSSAKKKVVNIWCKVQLKLVPWHWNPVSNKSCEMLHNLGIKWSDAARCGAMMNRWARRQHGLSTQTAWSRPAIMLDGTEERCGFNDLMCKGLAVILQHNGCLTAALQAGLDRV